MASSNQVSNLRQQNPWIAANEAMTRRVIKMFLGIVASLLILLIIIIGSYIILMFHTEMVFHVTEASLTQFNLTNNNTTLYYSFKVKIIAINLEDVEQNCTRVTATASYKDRAFGNVSLAPFFPGTTSSLQTAIFEGHNVIDLNPHQIAEYYNETHAGIYKDLVVDLKFLITERQVIFAIGVTSDIYYRMLCHLKVPIISNSTSVATFNDTKCF